MKVITHMQYGTRQSGSVQFLKCNISIARPFLHCWQSPRSQEVHFFACWNSLLILRQFWSEQGHALHWNACAKTASNFLFCNTNLQDYSLSFNDKRKSTEHHCISCLPLQVRIHVILCKPIANPKYLLIRTNYGNIDTIKICSRGIWTSWLSHHFKTDNKC